MSSRSLLDEPADLNAEPGSKPWARAVARAIRCGVKELDVSVEHVQWFISIATKHEAWKALGYVSLDAFLIKEANFTQATIDAIRSAKGGTVGDAIQAAKDAPELPKQGRPKKEEVGKGTDCTFIRGGNPEYTLRRLKRDAPELLDKIETGELSVNAAAIQAGIRKKPLPEDVCVKAFARCDDKLTLTKSLLSLLDETQKLVVHEWLQAIVVDNVDA